MFPSLINVKASRPVGPRAKLFGLDLGLGLVVSGLGLSLGLMAFGLGLIDIGLVASKIYNVYDINLLAMEKSGNFIWFDCGCYKLSSLNLRSQQSCNTAISACIISVDHQPNGNDFMTLLPLHSCPIPPDVSAAKAPINNRNLPSYRTT